MTNPTESELDKLVSGSGCLKCFDFQLVNDQEYRETNGKFDSQRNADQAETKIMAGMAILALVQCLC